MGSPPGTPGLSGFVPDMFVYERRRQRVARRLSARGGSTWPGSGPRLVRTDTVPDTDPFPYGICLLGDQHRFPVRAGRRARPDPGPASTRRSRPTAPLAAVVQVAQLPPIGAGAIVIYDTATGAGRCASWSAVRTPQPTWSPDGKTDRVRARRRHLRGAGDRRATRAPGPEGRRAAHVDVPQPRAPVGVPGGSLRPRSLRVRHRLRAAARARDGHAAARPGGAVARLGRVHRRHRRNGSPYATGEPTGRVAASYAPALVRGDACGSGRQRAARRRRSAQKHQMNAIHTSLWAGVSSHSERTASATS